MRLNIGDTVWCKSKFMFINEDFESKKTIIKSEVHLCIYKVVLLEIRQHSVIFSSIYLKNLFRLPDKYNFFEIVIDNISNHKNDLYNADLEKTFDIFNGVSFILGRNDLRDWVSDKLGIKESVDKYILEKYKEEGLSFDISVDYDSSLFGKIKYDINTHPFKYVEIPVRNWLDYVDYSRHHEIFSYLREVGIKGEKHESGIATIYGVVDMEGSINGYAKQNDLLFEGQFQGGPHGVIEIKSDSGDYYFKGVAEEGVPKFGYTRYEDGTIFDGDYKDGEPYNGKVTSVTGESYTVCDGRKRT